MEPFSFLMNEIVASRIILFRAMLKFSSPNSKRLLSASLSNTEKSNSGMPLLVFEFILGDYYMVINVIIVLVLYVVVG